MFTPQTTAGPSTVVVPRLSTPRTSALIAGASYVGIFICAVLANFVALTPLLDGDPSTTLSRLAGSATSLRWGTLAFLTITLVDVVAAWALFTLFRPVHHDLALLGAWFRLGYTVILGGALSFLHVALRGAESGVLDDAGTHLALLAFDFAWVVGLALFGVHLVLVGRLILKAAAGPRALALVLMLAGGAYVLDTAAHILLRDYEAHAVLLLAVVAVPSILGELALTVWLFLVGAGKRPAPAAAPSAS